MSTPDGSVADAAADVAVKAPRKFPLPCWTQGETLFLIDAYREKWYSLRRGYLRTADWDAVAATVADRCPDASPAKTSAQCRHKIEKLRQRYRAEKQRSLSFPYPSGRYISSWFFFDKMEAMENGTTLSASNRIPENSGELSNTNSSLDQNKLKLKFKANNSLDPYSDTKLHSSAQANRFSSDSKEAPRKYEEEEEEEDMSSDEDLHNLGPRRPMYGIPIHPLNSSSKKHGKNFLNYFGVDDGFHQDLIPPGNLSRQNNEELWEKISNNGNNCNSNFLRPTANSSKWGSRSVEKMVASIQSLGEGFMKMERAKMEMAKEMEAMRMEMEMKRSEMILESQKQIIDAFVKGLLTVKKNKRAKSDRETDLAEI